jgi:hypothetical protein
VIPAAPHSVEATGLSADLVLQMVAKTLLFAGQLLGSELADRLGVPYSVLDGALGFLKSERLCEVSEGSLVAGPSYRYRLTDDGCRRAALFLEQNQYVGCLPVPLAQYTAHMQRVFGSGPMITRAAVAQALSHLVINDRMLDQLGPAVAARHSLFIYGAPGNGKTVIAQALRNLLPGDTAIPHALEVDGQIIRMFDPVTHERTDIATSDSGLTSSKRQDRRWVPAGDPWSSPAESSRWRRWTSSLL